MKKTVQPLLQWYEQNARTLPWRMDKNPYHIWLSEIMLQQTRVEAVKGYYHRFLEALPTVKDLANVEEDRLMKLWQGLGYYNRARNLQKAAVILCDTYGEEFPTEYEQWLALPGIGAYTAGAVTSIAFNRPVPAVDGNVYRIYTRLNGDDTDISKSAFQKKVRQELLEIMPERAGDFNQAWMDLGAMVCLPNGAPHCRECPLRSMCYACLHDKQLHYPVRPVKKQRKIQERTVLVFEYQNQYYIQKRPQEGLLSGLWEFPSREGYLSPEQLTQTLQHIGVYPVGGTKAPLQLLGKAKHIFSHVEWHMLGYLVSLDEKPDKLSDNGIFCSVEALRDTYSIPNVYQYYLSYLLTEQK